MAHPTNAAPMRGPGARAAAFAQKRRPLDKKTAKRLFSYITRDYKPQFFLVLVCIVISDEIKITGDDKDKVKTLCIYWEWYLDANEAKTDGKPGLSTDDITEWDSLDTDVGRYPDKYYDAFTMYIKTTGTQVTPTPTNGQRKKTTTGTNK